MTRYPTPDALQEECDRWNARNPVGTAVEYQKLRRTDEPWHYSTTESEAYVMGGHTAVIMLAGVSGCYALDFVRPRLLTPHQAAD